MTEKPRDVDEEFTQLFGFSKIDLDKKVYKLISVIESNDPDTAAEQVSAYELLVQITNAVTRLAADAARARKNRQPKHNYAKVTLFKNDGNYDTEEEWRIPDNANNPHDMINSPDFRRIGDGFVLVQSRHPWESLALL